MNSKLLCALFLILAAFAWPAQSADPHYFGRVKDINLLNSWIAIDSRRLQITPRTEIRNLESPNANYLRAIKQGQPVAYTATRNHELLQLWIYPIDQNKLRELLGNKTLERLP